MFFPSAVAASASSGGGLQSMEAQTPLTNDRNGYIANPIETGTFIPGNSIFGFPLEELTIQFAGNDLVIALIGNAADASWTNCLITGVFTNDSNDLSIDSSTRISYIFDGTDSIWTFNVAPTKGFVNGNIYGVQFT